MSENHMFCFRSGTYVLDFSDLLQLFNISYKQCSRARLFFPSLIESVKKLYLYQLAKLEIKSSNDHSSYRLKIYSFVDQRQPPFQLN
jgi:hypothetical protein